MGLGSFSLTLAALGWLAAGSALLGLLQWMRIQNGGLP